MMTPIEINIPIEPVAKQADRQRIIKTKAGGQFIHHYQPKKIKQNQRDIAAFCAPHRPERPIDGAIRITIMSSWPWLKSHNKRDRLAPYKHKTTKPDCENISKQILDVLESMGFFAVGDSQVAELIVRKVWTHLPGTMIRIESLEPGVP